MPERCCVVRSSSWVLLSLGASLLLILIRPLAAAEPSAFEVERIQALVDRLRSELGVRAAVTVVVRPHVALIVSVEAPTHDAQPFLLAIEERFLARLSAEELDAAVAHELGHVWLFTHHPYLQTERLANQIAMRVVPRESLVSVYQRMWEHGGTRGELETVLGP